MLITITIKPAVPLAYRASLFAHVPRTQQTVSGRTTIMVRIMTRPCELVFSTITVMPIIEQSLAHTDSAATNLVYISSLQEENPSSVVEHPGEFSGAEASSSNGLTSLT